MGFSANGSYHLDRHSFLASSRKTKQTDAKRGPREEAVRALRAHRDALLCKASLGAV